MVTDFGTVDGPRVRVCARARERARVRTCMCACACVRTCVCVCVIVGENGFSDESTHRIIVTSPVII